MALILFQPPPTVIGILTDSPGLAITVVSEPVCCPNDIDPQINIKIVIKVNCFLMIFWCKVINIFNVSYMFVYLFAILKTCFDHFLVARIV